MIHPAGLRLLLGLALTTGVVAGCSSTPAPDASRAAAPSPSGATRAVAPTGASATEVAPAGRALRVLRRWDRRRERALQGGDATALRGLYTSGSGLAAQDLRLLRTYRGRAARVLGVEVQVRRVDLLASRPSAIRVRVDDRVASARLRMPDGTVRTVRGTSYATRVISFEERAGRWRVSSVRAG